MGFGRRLTLTALDTTADEEGRGTQKPASYDGFCVARTCRSTERLLLDLGVTKHQKCSFVTKVGGAKQMGAVGNGSAWAGPVLATFLWISRGILGPATPACDTAIGR